MQVVVLEFAWQRRSEAVVKRVFPTENRGVNLPLKLHRQFSPFLVVVESQGQEKAT
jgi:hypothetical protein